MKFLFQLIGIVLLAHYSTQICEYPPPEWCTSTSDPIIRTFDGHIYNFRAITNYTLFYADRTNNDISITGSFLRCNLGCMMTCNCGFHFRAFDTTLFIDSCGLSNVTNAKMADLAKHIFAVYGNQLEQVDCTQKVFMASQETDQNWWNTPGNAVNINNQLLCARKFGSKTIVVRTNYRNVNFDVYARIIPAEKSGLAQVAIRAAPRSFKYTKGLCGRWNHNRTDDDASLYLVNGEYVFKNSIEDSEAFQDSELSDPPVFQLSGCDGKSLAECAYNVIHDTFVISSTVVVPRDQQELEDFCYELIYNEQLLELHELLNKETDYLEDYYRFCIDSHADHASDDTLLQLRTVIQDNVVPPLCEKEPHSEFCEGLRNDLD